LVQQAQFAIMYSFKYSPRPYTNALRYTDDVPLHIKEQRLSILQEFQKKIQKDFYNAMTGQEKEILVDGFSKRNPEEQSGRTTENIIVHFSGSSNMQGKTVLVRISQALNNCLRGEFIKTID